MTHPVLFQPIRVRNLELANRIVIAPMCQYSAENGCMTDWHLIHLGHLALSGAALLTIEATAVVPEGRITYADVGLWDDATARAMGRVLESMRRWSPMPVAIQLAHAGRKASSEVPWKGGAQLPPSSPHGWQTIAPSAVPFADAHVPPLPLDRQGLARVRDGFAAAARRAAALGIDAVQIHAAHGYLMHAFLSLLSNRRDDEYGGTLENRMRFPLEVFEAVRAVWPRARPMSVRVSATDWMPGGMTGADTVEVARAMKAAGCDLIDVSTGQTDPASKPVYGRMYQAVFSEQVRLEAGIATMAVGAITTADQVNTLLISGRADLVALARPHLADPYFTLHAAAEYDFRGIGWPVQYHTGATQLHTTVRRAKEEAERKAQLLAARAH